MRTKEWNQYTICEDGTIYKTKTGYRIKTYQKNRHGTVYVRLQGRSYVVARLIYETFAEITLGKREYIGYRDGNREHIAFANLMRTPKRTGRPKKLTKEQMAAIRKQYQEKGTYQQLAKQYGVSVNLISRIINEGEPT